MLLKHNELQGVRYKSKYFYTYLSWKREAEHYIPKYHIRMKIQLIYFNYVTYFTNFTSEKWSHPDIPRDNGQCWPATEDGNNNVVYGRPSTDRNLSTWQLYVPALFLCHRQKETCTVTQVVVIIAWLRPARGRIKCNTVGYHRLYGQDKVNHS